jgi:AcrR family transcriptional regulator
MSIPARASARPRRTQEQRSSEMRTRLLDATIECLVQYGYAGTTTPRVAEMAGVTRGAQVHHFGSKNELVLAALRHLAAKRTAAAVREVGDLRAGGDPLTAFLDVIWELHEDPIFVATVELWVAGRTDADLGREVAKFESIVVGSLSAAVAQMVPEDVNKSMLDFVFVAMDTLRGILISSYVDPDPERAHRRWIRAASQLRRTADPVLEEWAAQRP